MGWQFNRTVNYTCDSAPLDILHTGYLLYSTRGTSVDVFDYWKTEKDLTNQYGDDNYIFDKNDTRAQLTKLTTIDLPINTTKLTNGNGQHIWGVGTNQLTRINTEANKAEMYFTLAPISNSGSVLFEANKIWMTSHTVDGNDFSGLYYFNTAALVYPNMNFVIMDVVPSTNIIRCPDLTVYEEKFTVAVTVNPTTSAVTYVQTYFGNPSSPLFALTGVNVNVLTAVSETFTFTKINSTTWSVVGSISGSLPNYTIGTYDGLSARIAIPVLKNGSVDYDIASAYNGYIYLTNFNNWSLCKFNAVTGAFVNSIDMQNRDVRSIFTNSNKEIFVGSRNGMVSLVNSSTDGVTHPYNSKAEALYPDYMIDAGAYFWYVVYDPTPILVRMKKADKSIFFMGATSGDYKLETTNFIDAAGFSKVFSTPQYTYQTWDEGTSTFITKYMRPYIFIIDGSKIIGFRNYDTLYRENVNITRGVAMLSTGPNDYTGD